jgi:hypothetical protein
VQATHATVSAIFVPTYRPSVVAKTWSCATVEGVCALGWQVLMAGYEVWDPLFLKLYARKPIEKISAFAITYMLHPDLLLEGNLSESESCAVARNGK